MYETVPTALIFLSLLPIVVHVYGERRAKRYRDYRHVKAAADKLSEIKAHLAYRGSPYYDPSHEVIA